MGSWLCLSFNGWGITGFVKQSDTPIHRPLKNYYRNSECALMIEKLQVNKNIVPSPTRDKMISMLANALSFVTVDSTVAFKILFVTNALDGSIWSLKNFPPNYHWHGVFSSRTFDATTSRIPRGHCEKVDSAETNKKKGIWRNRVFHWFYRFWGSRNRFRGRGKWDEWHGRNSSLKCK